jgi:hypothetical protein
MLVIYMIASIQFLFKETIILMDIGKMSYSQKLDKLDKHYYKNYFYRYYEWLNELLPKDQSFSIFYGQKVNPDVYQRYVHKLDYYFYPRHVMFSGIEEDIAKPPHRPPKERLMYFKYSPAVFVLNTENIDFKRNGRIEYTFLNSRKYYLVAALDNKGLLMDTSLLRKIKGLENIDRAFSKLYGISIKKAVF